jgi:hypothetical protein
MDLISKTGLRGQLEALIARAHIENGLGRYYHSIQNHRNAQKLARLTGRVREECASVANEAIPWCYLGNFRKAQVCAAQGHALLLEHGLQGSDRELACLDMQAEIHFQKSEYLEARQIKVCMVQMTSRHRGPYYHSNALQELALIDIITGAEDSGVIRNLSAAKELSAELQWALGGVRCDLTQCQLDIRGGRVAKAYTELKKLAKITMGVGALESLGDLSSKMCGLDETKGWATTYFAFARKTKNLGRTYQALRCLGDIVLAEGDEETALNVFQAVLDGSTEMGVHRRRADCMSRIGDILFRRLELEKAKKMWQAARLVFDRSSRENDVATIDAKLAELARNGIEADSEAPRDDFSGQPEAEIPINVASF